MRRRPAPHAEGAAPDLGAQHVGPSRRLAFARCRQPARLGHYPVARDSLEATGPSLWCGDRADSRGRGPAHSCDRPAERRAAAVRLVDPEVVGSRLTAPTAFRLAPDGRIFVAERAVESSCWTDSAIPARPFSLASRTNVYDIWDLGLLGLALHPDFPRKPFVYVAYTHNAPIGGTAPQWPSRGGVDQCPDPPGCLKGSAGAVGPALVLTARGDKMDRPGAGAHRGLVSAVEYPFGRRHSFRSRRSPLHERRRFGVLRVRGLGGSRRPTNPCGDPPGDVGSQLVPPTAEGGVASARPVCRR